MTLPMVMGMFSMVAFNLADTYYVSRLGGDALAAMGFILPAVLLVGMVSMGLSVGTASVISRAIGEGDPGQVRRLTTHALALAVLTVAVFVAIGLLTIEAMFGVLGAKPELMPLIRQYMTIWYFGTVFVVVPMVGNGAIRAGGDTLSPGLIMVLGAGVNIVLDPLLIFGLWGLPRMEMAGAALATVISRALTMLASLSVLHFRKRMLTFTGASLRGVLHSWRQILFIGIPAAATSILFPLAMGAIMRMVAGFGKKAVAAVGAANRVEAVAMMVFWALGTTLLPFIGQNWGAGRHDRVRQVQKASVVFSLGWGLLSAIVFVPVAWPVARLFSDDPQVIRYMTWYFWILPVGYGLRGVTLLAGSSFNGMHRPGSAAILNILRMFGLYVPLAWLGGKLFGLYGLFGGLTVSNVVGGLVAMVWMLRASRRAAQVAAAQQAPELIEPAPPE
ncbi:MAG TPA: MATE family efflux transporter [Phycisphaerae bacterium]|nr:MATE family efflux transporter [Phycisphaerae bacterium]